MIVAVNAARIRADTTHRELVVKRRLSGTARVAPGRVAAESAHRRPVWHRGRRCTLVKTCKVAGAVDDLSADDRELRRRIGDLVLRPRAIVPARYGHVGRLPAPHSS